jgi:hypothetical protein
MTEPRRICQADDYAGTMCCGRCNLTWPVTAKGDDIPHCKDKADPPITLSEMREVVSARANDEVFSQLAIVKIGLGAPMRDRQRRIAVLRATGALIERCERDSEIMRRLREG